MQIEKKYYTVQDSETLKLMFQHIQESEVLAVDTETTSLNMRKGKIVGWSISGGEGIGFYIPTLVWDYEKEELVVQEINGQSTEVISKNLLSMLKGKKLVMHNASFDCRFTKNYYGVDLLEDLWVDTALLVHTVQEEGAGMGVFGLKPLAISIQKEIGLDVEEAANKEQVELKESIKQMEVNYKRSLRSYKADMAILSKYAAADTDLTLEFVITF
jgi:DNA polymerase I-like protein with 3'-5' exonuclease and polymerase domains